MRPGRRAGKPPRWPVCTILLAYSISSPQSNAFVWTPEKKTTRCSYYLVHSSSVSLARQRNNAGRITSSCTDGISLSNRPQVSSSQLHASAAISVVEVAARAQEGVVLADYAPAAASLFSNMKLPSAVLTAGMISLGFATGFPKLPPDSFDKVYPKEIRQLCSKLERLHIVLGLVSVTSELIVVLWAAVEVNNLTERDFAKAYSVWDLIHRECDLPWSAVNSHFILGIMGFTGMLWLRAYVMLLASKASEKLMLAALSGSTAGVCLMISIVNRGIESGGGNNIDRYGSSILDLLQHYAMLLVQAASNVNSPGPFQMSAIVLEAVSLSLLFLVLVTESDAAFEEQGDDDSCPVDAYDILNDDEELAKLSQKEVEKLETCMILESEDLNQQEDSSASREKDDVDSGGFSSVNIM